MKKNVFIIGLGRFGQSLATLLHNSGYDVTISDVNEKIVNYISSSYEFTNQIVIDSTNFETLKSTSVKLADYVIVAISKIEDSVLTCVNLKDIGVKNIIAKAQNKTHARLLKSIGVSDIIFPEDYAAKMIANKIINGELDIIKQGDLQSILKIRVTNDKVVGHLIDDYVTDDLTIFAILKNESNSIIKYTTKNQVIKKLDTLYIMCSNDKLKWIKRTFIDNKNKK